MISVAVSFRVEKGTLIVAALAAGFIGGVALYNRYGRDRPSQKPKQSTYEDYSRPKEG